MSFLPDDVVRELEAAFYLILHTLTTFAEWLFSIPTV